MLDPIPECLADSFTVDALPEYRPRFEPDCTALCHYSIALSTVLTGYEPAGKTATALRDLLCELTSYFVEEMMAPQWVKRKGVIERNQYA